MQYMYIYTYTYVYAYVYVNVFMDIYVELNVYGNVNMFLQGVVTGWRNMALKWRLHHQCHAIIQRLYLSWNFYKTYPGFRSYNTKGIRRLQWGFPFTDTILLVVREIKHYDVFRRSVTLMTVHQLGFMWVIWRNECESLSRYFRKLPETVHDCCKKNETSISSAHLHTVSC